MILVRLRGGLGNQMFQYAFGRRLAFERSEQLVLDLSLLGEGSKEGHTPIRDFELSRFPIKAKVASNEEIRSFFLEEKASLWQRLNFKIKTTISKQSLYLQYFHESAIDVVRSLPSPLAIVGRWQSEGYFEPIKDEILGTFNLDQFSPTHVTADLLDAIQKDSRPSVAVHVRRGDYITSPLFSKELGALTAEYYQNAINYVRAKTEQEPVFYFISQDQEWCRQHFGGLPHAVFVDQDATTEGYFSDLKLIGSTEWSVLSNSTFAWWGAYLGRHTIKKHILAPSRWAINDLWVPPNIVPGTWGTLPSLFEVISDLE